MTTMQARVIATGLAFGESARWHDSRLWLCNWGTGEIVAVNEGGTSEVMLTVPAVLPYSIDWLPDGRLLVISGREGLLLRQEADGSLVTHADLRGLSKSPWNEIVVDGRGNIYVNGGGPAPAPGQHFGPGTIVLVTGDGTVRQVADNIAFANGMAVTPDNRCSQNTTVRSCFMTGFSERRRRSQLGPAANEVVIHAGERHRRGMIGHVEAHPLNRLIQIEQQRALAGVWHHALNPEE